MFAHLRLFALGIFALVFAACSPPVVPASQSQQSVPAKSIRIMIRAEPEGFTAIERREWLKEVIDSNVLEPLIDLDTGGKPVPRLATAWEQRDPTTWRLQLRKGVKFHNGEPFTGRDVVETAKWLIEEQKTSAIYGYMPISEATLVDDNTVDLKFGSPQPLFLIQQINFLIYPASIASEKTKREQAARSPIGTGPYKFANWETGRAIRLARFDDYWGSKPNIGGVEITWRAEPGVRLAALLAQEADWVMDIPLEEVTRAPKTASLTVPDRYEFRLDTAVQQNPTLADKRLRLALDYSLDRQGLLKLFGGQAVMLQGQLALPGEFGYNPNVKARPYDLERAKQLVSEANAVGRTLNMTCGDQKRPKQREICQASASMFEKTGLKINVLMLAPGEDQQYTTTQGPNRGVKVSDIHQVAPDFLLESEGRFGKSFNKGSLQVAYEDQVAWDLFSAAKADTNLDTRGEKLGKAWARLYEEAYYLPLVVPTVVHGLAPNLEWNVNIAGWPAVADMRFTN